MCVCNFAIKGRPRNDLYCVRWDVKPYLLTHSLTGQVGEFQSGQSKVRQNKSQGKLEKISGLFLINMKQRPMIIALNSISMNLCLTHWRSQGILFGLESGHHALLSVYNSQQLHGWLRT